MHPRFVALIAGVITLSLVGVLVSSANEPATDPLVPEPPPEHRAEGFFGIAPQTDLTEKDWARMAAGGVSIVRLGLTWDAVQSDPGDCQAEPSVAVCSWTRFDSTVGEAAAHGIRVLPVLGGHPGFVDDGQSDDYIRQHPPISGEGLAGWRDFVRAAAARYGRNGEYWPWFKAATGQDPLPIEEWQVWNEPNATAYWPPKPDAEEYATLVRETSTALRESDPDAEVVLGGMFGTATVNSRKFLRTLYSVDGIQD